MTTKSNKLNDKGAVTTAIRNMGKESSTVSEAVIVCLVALQDHRNTGQINRLIGAMIAEGRKADVADVVAIARHYTPVKAPSTPKPAKPDWTKTELQFKRRRKTTGAETWRVDSLRVDMLREDGKGTFRTLAASLRGESKARGATAVSESLATLLNKRASEAPYSDATRAAIKRAIAAAESDETAAEKPAETAETAEKPAEKPRKPALVETAEAA